MTIHYEDFDAAFTSVSYRTPGSEIGELALEPGQYAITIGGSDSQANICGTVEELAEFARRVESLIPHILAHRVGEGEPKAEPEPELPAEVRAAKEQGLEVWTTAQMQELFKAEEFSAPFVIVTRKSDGARGTLQFSHRPRYYFGFVAES